jgi:hypothetical protein
MAATSISYIGSPDGFLDRSADWIRIRGIVNRDIIAILRKTAPTKPVA